MMLIYGKFCGESDTQIILTTVAMAIAGGGMLVPGYHRQEGGISVVVAVLVFLIVVAIGVSQLVSDYLLD